ncbi:MAG: stage III sporulation protein AF [Clostridia bacterium]|nr:stage III sporulation protein AF [Clostridia bacterium]
MEYLKEYASNIIIISMLSTVFQILLPDGKQKKYVILIIGLVVMLVVMKPLEMITEIKNNFFEMPHFEIETQSDYLEKNLVADRFEEDLALTIKEKVKENMGENIDCFVEVGRNEEGQITEIEKVDIRPYSENLVNYICEEFGIAGSVIKGEKND